MIVARLEPRGEGAERHMVGKTVCNWEHTAGTRLVLKRDHNGEWVLMELGPRETRRSERGLLSFVDE